MSRHARQRVRRQRIDSAWARERRRWAPMTPGQARAWAKAMSFGGPFEFRQALFAAMGLVL
jgi:hypothetical protein